MKLRILAFTCGAAALFALAPHPSRANADAPADGGASDAGPPAPPFDAEPFPEGPTPAPKPDEWRAATPVSLTRNGSPCRAYRVREWMKVDCSHLVPAGLAQITGPSEGVALAIAQAGRRDFALVSRNMEVIFPLRRGTGHMFMFMEIGEGYEGPSGAIVALILGDHWVDGEGPIITLH
jgi:hypothetical protein